MPDCQEAGCARSTSHYGCHRAVVNLPTMPRTTTRGAALALLLLGSEVSAFSLRLPPQRRAPPRSKTLLQAKSRRAAAAALTTALVASRANAAPADQRWAASEFFDEVRNGAVDRVTFAAEGGALVAVDCRAESKFHDATSVLMFPRRSMPTAAATTCRSSSRKSPRPSRLYEPSGSPSRYRPRSSRTAASWASSRT